MEQRRIKVEGWSGSDINVVVAVIQSRTGQIHLAIEGVEPTIPNLVNIRQMLDAVVQKIDEHLPKLVQDSVAEMNK
jgi:hypothetical protein